MTHLYEFVFDRRDQEHTVVFEARIVIWDYHEETGKANPCTNQGEAHMIGAIAPKEMLTLAPEAVIHLVNEGIAKEIAAYLTQVAFPSKPDPKRN